MEELTEDNVVRESCLVNYAYFVTFVYFLKLRNSGYFSI